MMREPPRGESTRSYRLPGVWKHSGPQSGDGLASNSNSNLNNASVILTRNKMQGAALILCPYSLQYLGLFDSLPSLYFYDCYITIHYCITEMIEVLRRSTNKAHQPEPNLPVSAKPTLEFRASLSLPFWYSAILRVYTSGKCKTTYPVS